MTNIARWDQRAPTTAPRGRLARLTVGLVVGLVFCSSLRAQTASPPADDRAVGAQRAELEAAAARAEAEAARAGTDAGLRSRKQAEASVLRERLRDGDFIVGDRVFVEMRGAEQPFNDTVTVRAGRMVTIGTLPEISLHGVLRSELDQHLAREVGRYVREPQVDAQSYVRLSVLGAVGQQGFYAFPADILLTDALMRSGGMRADTDLEKITIKRNQREVVSKEEARQAIRDGRTLDQLNIRAGDEITVGEKRQVNWRTILRTASIGLSITFLIIRLANN